VGPGVRTTEGAAAGVEAVEASRWWGGLSIDKTFPLRSLLVSAEAYADQAVIDDADIVWHTGVGARYQFTPRVALDGGVGRRLTGEDREWHVTIGWAYALGIP
jgi:hypothetical protein